MKHEDIKKSTRVGLFLLLAGLATSPLTSAAPLGVAYPTFQTTNEGKGTDMDDPAIWIPEEQSDRHKTLVVATVKKGGLRVYNLVGKTLQKMSDAPNAKGEPTSSINNVDIQYDFPLGAEKIDIAVATDRLRDKLRIWRIDGNAEHPLSEITAPDFPRLFPTSPDPENLAKGSIPNPDDGKKTAYGMGLYRDQHAGKYFVLVTQNSEAVVAKWELFATTDGKVSARFVKDWRFPYVYKGQDLTKKDKDDPSKSFSPQFEGVAIDQESGIAYAGQEDVGIWRIHLKKGRDFAEPKPFVETRAFNPASPLARDLEGLMLYYTKNGKGYLMASSQGHSHGKPPLEPIPEIDDTFAVFTREGKNAYLGSFRIEPNKAAGIDGVQECDGGDVTSVQIPGFEDGLLITQDGYSGDFFDKSVEATNMKFTSWRSVAKGFPRRLDTESNYNPRKPGK